MWNRMRTSEVSDREVLLDVDRSALSFCERSMRAARHVRGEWLRRPPGGLDASVSAESRPHRIQ